MEQTHEVYGRHRSRKKVERLGTYPAERWQWALKHANYLKDIGYKDVEVRPAKPKAKKKA